MGHRGLSHSNSERGGPEERSLLLPVSSVSCAAPGGGGGTVPGGLAAHLPAEGPAGAHHQARGSEIVLSGLLTTPSSATSDVPTRNASPEADEATAIVGSGRAEDRLPQCSRTTAGQLPSGPHLRLRLPLGWAPSPGPSSSAGARLRKGVSPSPQGCSQWLGFFSLFLTGRFLAFYFHFHSRQGSS